MTPDVGAFLSYVRTFVAEHPEAAAYVADYARAGLEEALAKASERAADMEVALVVATAERFKNRDAVILEKLMKWQGKTACRWDDLIERLSTRRISK